MATNTEGLISSERFTSSTLDSKLKDLNSTMQSIQGVSQWLISHKKHAKTIVGIWYRDVQKGMLCWLCMIHNYAWNVLAIIIYMQNKSS